MELPASSAPETRGLLAWFPQVSRLARRRIRAQARLLGLVNVGELHLAAQASHAGSWILAEEMMRGDVRPLRPEDPLDRALQLFVDNDLLVLPIVASLEERKVIGMVRCFDVASAYLRRVHGSASGPRENAAAET